MSSNKSIREKMIELYGPECFIEKLHLRKDKQTYTGKAQYEKLKQLTYHHIKMRKDGGQATVENGALLSVENHQWFHKQGKAAQKKMNEAFQKYKMVLVGLELTGDGRIGNQVMMDLKEPDSYIEIPLIPNKEEKINPENVIRARYEEQWEK